MRRFAVHTLQHPPMTIEQRPDNFDLIRSRARIRAALDGVITIDARGVVAEWNPAAELIFGYSADEAIGRNMAELIVPPDLREAHHRGMEHYLATGEGPALDTRLEMPAVRADGTQITIELTITAFTVSGEHWFTGWARDITEIIATREELEQSRRRFESIVEHSSDVITVLDNDGTWLYTSDAGTRLTGYEKGFDPEGGIFSLLHPDDQGLAARALAEVANGLRRPDEPVELRIVDKQGHIRWFETVGVNLVDNPAVGGIVLHARDVTERREAERDLRVRTRQLSGLLRHIQFGVLVEDEHRCVAIANQALADMFNSPVGPDEMVGADCSEVAHAIKGLFADPEGFISGIEERIDQRQATSGEELAMGDGRVLERDYIPVIDGDTLRSHIWLYRDVTDRKLAEAQRERTLEAEQIARRNMEASQAALQEQNESLRQLDTLKTELVATVSHELRTPLTSIVSFSELLSDPEAGPLNVMQTTFVDTIQRNADRLIRLVDDLLLLARLESQNLQLDVAQSDLAVLARQVVASQAPRAAEAGIEVELDSPETAPAAVDPARIEQLLNNLVSNAVKFGANGGSVTVTIAPRDDGWDIAVSDTGIGIPSDELEQLFQRFFRASNARSKMISGTGLGLAICNAIARLHGGSMSVSSIENEGSTFTTWLPAAAGERHDE